MPDNTDQPISTNDTTAGGKSFKTSAAVLETIKNFPATQPIGFQYNATRQATKAGVTPAAKISPAQQTLPAESGIQPESASVVEGPPSIVELSRALNVDSNGPQYMFEYVANQIDWEPGWGQQSGALGCLCNGMGNSFDQSLLLANLLRQAGFTANIVMGTIRLLDTQYEAWWNVPDIWGAQSYCLNEYIPIVTAPTWNGTQYYMDIRHVWVEWVSGSTTYYFDPSYKTYTRKTGLTSTALASALGYTASTFLSDAESGATIDGSGNYVQNMNRTNVRNDLKTFTSNLVTYIGGNAIGSAPAGTATVDDVLGGQSIVPVTLPVLKTSLGYEMPGDVPTVWTGDVPAAYKPTLQVQFPNFNNPNIWDFTWSTTSDLLACTRLTLWYTSLVPSLYLNGTVKATGVAQPSGSYNSLYLTVVHPAYAASNYPQSDQQYYQTTWSWWQSNIYAGEYYLVGNAWGNLGRGQLDYHQTQAAAAQAAGDSSTSEALLGERMAIAFFQWGAQNSRVADLVNRIMSCKTMYSHQVGMISFNNGGDGCLATDLGGISGSSDYLPNLSDYATETSINDTVLAMHGVALEAATCAQVTGVTPGISATEILDRANRTCVITVGGTVTVGDVLTISVHDAALSGGVKSDSVTVATGDTLTSIATKFATAINGDTSLAAIGVSATSSGTAIFILSTSVNQTTYTTSASAGATETSTIAFEKIYKGTSSNWNSGINVASILHGNGYNASDMTNVYNWYIQYGDTVVIPDHPLTTLGSWTGWGYWVFPTAGASGIINGVVKGGSGNPGPPGDGPPDPNPGENYCGAPVSAEPISFFTGSYFYTRTDITLGSQNFPYGLSFQRQYNSGNQYINGALGRGWTHNHAITATVGSDGLLAMGDQFAVQGAASIAELYVCTDIFSDTTRPTAKLVTATLADSWWIDQIVNNTVVVAFGDTSWVFVKQPSGSYTAPAALPSTLTLSAGLYVLTTPQGVKYNFNSSGQISTLVSPAGVTITYTYSSGKLSTISNGLGRTLTLNYTGSNITSVSDGNGRSVSYNIDSSNDLTIFTDGNSNQTTYQYDQPGRMTKLFKPQNPTTAFMTNVYDSLSRVETQSNGRGQTWTYFLANSRAEEHDPLGNTHVLYLNKFGQTLRDINALLFETDYQYDGLNRQTQMTLTEGNQAQWTYDKNNNILTLTMVPKSGSGLSNIVQYFTYDPTWATIKTFKDGNGNTYTWAYDPTLGNLLSLTKPTVSAGTPQEQWTYNARGQALTYTDETSIVTKFTYDTSTEKLLTQIVDYAVSGHLNLTTSYGYNAWGDVNSITDPNTNVTNFVFDHERRKTQKTDPTPFSYVTNYGYDKDNNLNSVERQTGGSPAWQTYSMVYTVTDKINTLTDPASNVTTWNYDGKDRLENVIDAQTREYQYAYDALDRVHQITDPTSTICDTRLYTNNGYLASREDANSHTTQYSYDGLDRPNKTTYADTSFEQNSSYDSNNNVLTHLTRSGNSIVKTYDVLNRLSTKAPTSEATATYAYDLHNRKLSSSTPVVSGNPATGTFSFSYDTAGRFYKENTPDSKTTTFVLDSNGNVAKITYPDGYYVSRVYDQLNRVTDIKLNGASTAAVHIVYDELSRRKTMTLGNGVSIGYTYQLNEDLTSLAATFVGSSVTFGYGFNNVHQATTPSVTDSTYMWHPSAAGTTSYGTANSVNEYPTVGSATYTYDGNANLKGDGTWTFTYDTENHLTAARETGTSVSYVYDADHRQIQKTVGSTTSYYVYSGWQRIADYASSGSGALQNRYVYGDKLDEPLIVVSSSGALTYLHADRIGSIIATTNSSGAVTNKSVYSAFGENPPVGTTFGFTGQRYDSDTGLYYYKLRYYSPVIGRFLQPDPIGYADSLNLYCFGMNDPLNRTDKMGTASDPSNPNPWGSNPNPWGSNPNPWGSDPNPWGSNPNPWGSNPNPWGSNSNPWGNGGGFVGPPGPGSFGWGNTGGPGWGSGGLGGADGGGYGPGGPSSNQGPPDAFIGQMTMEQVGDEIDKLYPIDSPGLIPFPNEALQYDWSELLNLPPGSIGVPYSWGPPPDIGTPSLLPQA